MKDVLLGIIRGDIDVSEVDTSMFIMPVTTLQGLRNVRLKSYMELMQLAPAAFDTAEKFKQAFITKQYEIEFIDYLISLSSSNLELVSDNSTTEE